MSEFKYKINQFLRKNSYWFWASITTTLFIIIVLIENFALKEKFITSDINLFVNGALSIIGLDVALLTFLVSSSNLNMGNHLQVFIKVLYVSLVASVLTLTFYIFWNYFFGRVSYFVNTSVKKYLFRER